MVEPSVSSIDGGPCHCERPETPPYTALLSHADAWAKHTALALLIPVFYSKM